MKRLFLVLVLVISLSACGSTQTSTEQSPTPQIAQEESAVVEPVKTEPTMTLGQENALGKANSYLSLTAFSSSGLVKQLEFEGFSNADAVWAVEKCGADWNEQAALKADEYMKMTSFSKQGLIDQLVFEGFSSDQANYGASAVGY